MGYSARLLAKGDEDIVDAFLAPYTAFALFMRSNLQRGGIVFDNKIYQADYIGAFNEGSLIGMLAHSWLGTVQLFAPAIESIESMASVLRKTREKNPREVTAFLGPAQHVSILLEKLGIDKKMLRGNDTRPEGLFHLDLSAMISPVNGGVVRYAEVRDSDVLISWRHDFYVESLGDEPGEAAFARARDEINRRIAEKQLFVMEVDGELVSFCGVHGFLPDWRNIGPVWTPPDQRGRQYARIVVAEALATLRRDGVTHAVLFTQNPYAERAYRSLGFECIGDWRLDFLKRPVSML